jgi:hypothetical protein
MVEAVLADAELLRSTPILRDAYRVAGTVTGEARFERKVNEPVRLLIAQFFANRRVFARRRSG